MLRFKWTYTLFFLVCLRTCLHAQNPLLIIRPDGNAFNEVVNGISDELHEEFVIHQLTISEKTTVDFLSKKINTLSPRLVVLMDNKSINLYKKWQKSIPDSTHNIPSVSCMASFLDKAVEGLKNTTGISYEIPIITSLINFRSILKSKLNKVGVIHRSFAKGFIHENKEYCVREKITLVNYEITQKAIKQNYLRKAIKTLIKKEKVDALLVLNDNALLRPELIRNVWIPLVNWYKKPVIVGVEVLINPKIDFGVFAVLPDHINLGQQIAEKILNIKDNGWVVTEESIEPPLSIIKVINLKKANKYFGIEEKDLENIDKILK